MFSINATLFDVLQLKFGKIVHFEKFHVYFQFGNMLAILWCGKKI